MTGELDKSGNTIDAAGYRNAAVEAAAQAVVQHIQACFAAEATVAAQIEAASDPAGFDIQAAFGASVKS